MKKKLLKQTAAAVLLSSSFLSLTPPAYGNTTSIEQSIDSIKLEMKKARASYVNSAIEGKLTPSSSLYSILNNVKDNYQGIKKEIINSKLPEKEKQAKLKEIDTIYNENIIKGLIPYIDAYNYATKYLDPLLVEIKEAEEKNDLAAVEKAYHKLSVQLKSRTSILYRFSGKASRDLLLENYKEPADTKRDELMVPVTIYMKVTEADKLMSEGKKEEAQKVLESVSSLIKLLTNPEKSSFITALIQEVEKVQGTVETPAAPPSTSGGSNSNSNDTDSGYTPPSSGNDSGNNSGSDGESAVVKTALETKIAEAKAALEGAVEGSLAGQYAEGSIKKLQEAIKKAEVVTSDEEATQAAVDKAISELEEAISTFEEAKVADETEEPPVEKTALETKIAEAEAALEGAVEGSKAGQYAEGSIEKLQEAIKKAEAVTSDEQAVVEIAISELEEAISTFEEAKVADETEESPVVKTALETKIAEAEAALEVAVEGSEAGQYAKGSIEKLQEAIKKAEVVTSDELATQAEVNIAISELEEAISSFEEAKVADETEESPVVKTALETMIAEAEATLEGAVEGSEAGQYAKGSIEKLQEAIKKAKVVTSDELATQAEVNIAISELEEAISSFEEAKVADETEESPVVKTALETKIAEAEAALGGAEEGSEEGQYAEGSIKTLQEAINEAELVVSSNQATQATVDIAETTLNEAIKAFKSGKVEMVNGEVKGKIDELTSNGVTIDGKTYSVDNKLKAFFQIPNNLALNNGEITVEVTNNVIVNVVALTLTNNGSSASNIILDGGGAVIDGSVVIEGDYNSVNNLIVNKDFTISSNVENSFKSDNLTVKGTAKIDETQKIATVASLFAIPLAEQPKTKITVIFKDSTMAVIEIAKEDVNFSATGSTEVTTLRIQANANIYASKGTILPNVQISKGATLVELNATIANVVIESNDQVTISGKGHFDNVFVNSTKKVTLDTTGTILNLEMQNKSSKIAITGDSMVGNIIVPEGKEVKDLVDGFDTIEVKEKFQKISGITNEGFNEDLLNKSEETYFAAGINEVKGKFGYVTLDLVNQGEYEVRYQLIDLHEGDIETPGVWEQVPNDALSYKQGDSFVYWAGHALVVYQVDTTGKILDKIEVIDSIYPIEGSFKSEKTFTMKMTLKPDSYSVSDLMEYVYLYNGASVEKIVDFKSVTWDKVGDITAINLELKNKVDLEKPVRLFVRTERFGILGSHIGNINIMNKEMDIFILHDLVNDTNPNLRTNEFSYVLGWVAYKEVEKVFPNGEKYTTHESIAESDSVSAAQYRKELVNDKESLKTAEAITQMVNNVNVSLKDRVDKYKKAREKVNNLFKEDRHQYRWYNQLGENVTEQAIAEARVAIEAMDEEFLEKNRLINDVNFAEYLLSLK
ncbi:FIVAR domain-containing protein [Psychrobacillus sp. OK032]|uniref:FIVAR domain-containing protein n=1 Tax=Psychrobacillus sp. OK032 TaxID=1884358 RepID=UPI0008B51B74|nr:FIVAR domain-containing protein [Psychrobacillus sp. OK032]SES04227.1 hypothetical protein SAMN05518872_103381 [Psychrobacillus sp. OK032]